MNLHTLSFILVQKECRIDCITLNFTFLVKHRVILSLRNINN